MFPSACPLAKPEQAVCLYKEKKSTLSGLLSEAAPSWAVPGWSSQANTLLYRAREAPNPPQFIIYISSALDLVLVPTTQMTYTQSPPPPPLGGKRF